MKKFVLLAAFLAAPAIAQDRVKLFDVDNDGRVSYNELTATCEVSMNLFRKADKDNDGYLSNTEMRTGKAYLFNNCKKGE